MSKAALALKLAQVVNGIFLIRSQHSRKVSAWCACIKREFQSSRQDQGSHSIDERTDGPAFCTRAAIGTLRIETEIASRRVSIERVGKNRMLIQSRELAP